MKISLGILQHHNGAKPFMSSHLNFHTYFLLEMIVRISILESFRFQKISHEVDAKVKSFYISQIINVGTFNIFCEANKTVQQLLEQVLTI